MWTTLALRAASTRSIRPALQVPRRTLATASPPAASSSSRPLDSSSAPSSLGPDVSEAWSIPRTASGELPVYSKVRNGGGWRTIIRKVEGDVRILQSELNTYLRNSHIDPLRAPPSAVLRPTNRHLEIRGRWVGEVKNWLEGRGF